jgi:hypothetical protein
MARSNDHDGDRHPDDPTFRPGAVNPVPTPATVPATDSAARLRDLRLLAERNQLNDADKAELAKLNAAESEAAGHAKAVEVKAGPDDGSWVIYELLSFIEQIIARTPAYHDLDLRVRMLRNRFDASRDPEKKDAAKAA